MLAGMIQRPSYLNPYRHPERALERRNLVLESMVETGTISREEAEKAKATPLKLAAPNVEASDAPYFVDMVKDVLVAKYGEREFSDQAYRIYTTIDPDLQRAAAEAVQAGMVQVDEQLTKLRTKRKKVGTGKEAKYETTVAPGPQAQVALVVLDPHTGELLALVGGRNYGQSQLNHAVARRPTGSIFKPFVYAAAMNTALTGGPTVWTPASLLQDEQTTFLFDNQVYEPQELSREYKGEVSAEYALAHSLNNATIKLAEAVGYGNVAQLAKAAGIKSVQATPAMALGAYDATPIDMAGAYTVFANNGQRVSPLMIRAIHNSQGELLQSYTADTSPVLDPRVAYVMTSMMEGVVNTGTGFVGPTVGIYCPGGRQDRHVARRVVCRLYQSNLFCIVWVGLDDYSDIRLSGTAAAAPIWAEFMKRATDHPGLSGCDRFQAAGWRDRCAAGQDHEPAGNSVVPGNVYRGFHRGNGTERYLRSDSGRTPGSTGQDLWVDESKSSLGVSASEPKPAWPSGAPTPAKWGDGSGCGSSCSAETREEKGFLWQAGWGFQGRGRQAAGPKRPAAIK